MIIIIRILLLLLFSLEVPFYVLDLVKYIVYKLKD
jgi:hypothetical protein